MKLIPLFVLFAAPLFAATPASAQTSHYLSLDGDHDFVFSKGLQGLAGVTDYTVEAWVRSSGGNSANKLLLFGSEPTTKWAMQASCGTGGGISFAQEMPQPTGGTQVNWPTTTFCDGVWHHVAYTSDATTLSAYLDGSLVGTVPSLGQTWNMDGRDMYAGARLLGDDDYWNGDLDELRVWRRALTSAEIATSATWQLPSNTSDLVSAWDFENGAADALGLNDAQLAGDATIVAHAFSISGITPRASWDASDITVLGTGFDGTELVTIDGMPAAISTWTPTQLDLALPPSAPGFVDVTASRGSLIDSGELELWPTLAAESTGIGGTATVDLGFTGVGLHVLALSDQVMSMVPIGSSWFGLELAQTPGFAIMGAGVSGSDGKASWSYAIPQDPTLSGLNLYLQAWSQEGLFTLNASSFSNTVGLTL